MSNANTDIVPAEPTTEVLAQSSSAQAPPVGRGSTKDITHVKQRIHNSLHKIGVANGLKAQLRHGVVQALRGEGKISKNLGAASSDAPAGDELTLIQRVTASLVLDYLKHTQKSYALSVFLPESGLLPADVLGKDAILDILQVGNHAALFSAIKNSSEEDVDHSLLERMIVELRATLQKPHSSDSSTQTQDTFNAQTIDEKLSLLEKQFANEKDNIKKPYQSMEERMLKFERSCEARYQRDLELEVRRIRQLEVQTMRLQEAQKARNEMSKAREAFEKECLEREERMRIRAITSKKI